MTKFIVKGKVKYNGTTYSSGSVVEVDQKDVAEFKKHGWEIVGDSTPQSQATDYSKLTNKQLEEELTKRGIEFEKGAKKAVLLELLGE